MRVDAQREPDVAVPGQRLSHLGRNPGPFQAGNEEVPGAVEVGVEPVVVAVAEKVGLLPLSLCLRGLGLFDPVLTGNPNDNVVSLDRRRAETKPAGTAFFFGTGDGNGRVGVE